MTEPTVPSPPDKTIRIGPRRWPLALGALICIVAGVLVAVLITSNTVRKANPPETSPTPTVTDPVTPTDPAPRPAPAWFALDDFERAAVRNGLGTAPIGGRWSILGHRPERKDFAVRDGSAIIALRKPGNGREAYLGKIKQVSSDLRVSFAIEALPRGGPLYVYVFGRRVADYSAYAAVLYIDPRGRVRLSLSAYLDSQDGLNISDLVWPTVIGAGETLHVRVQTFRVNPTQLRVKVWRADEAEPVDWAIEMLDKKSPGLQRPGAIGFGSYVSMRATNAPARVRLLDLSAKPV